MINTSTFTKFMYYILFLYKKQIKYFGGILFSKIDLDNENKLICKLCFK